MKRRLLWVTEKRVVGGLIFGRYIKEERGVGRAR